MTVELRADGERVAAKAVTASMARGASSPETRAKNPTEVVRVPVAGGIAGGIAGDGTGGGESRQ